MQFGLSEGRADDTTKCCNLEKCLQRRLGAVIGSFIFYKIQTVKMFPITLNASVMSSHSITVIKNVSVFDRVYFCLIRVQ